MLILVLYFLFLAILLAFAFAMLGTLFADAPFVPTGRSDIRKLMEQLQIGNRKTVFDLGSGDGRIVRALAAGGAKATGIEQSLTLILWSRLTTFLWRFFARKTDVHAQFVHGDFHDIDLSQADVVFCYLLPEAMVKLKEKFARELQPGARVISRAFTIPGLVPSHVLRFSKRKMPVYVYVILPVGEREFIRSTAIGIKRN